jgi:hypothetical protein
MPNRISDLRRSWTLAVTLSLGLSALLVVGGHVAAQESSPVSPETSAESAATQEQAEEVATDESDPRAIVDPQPKLGDLADGSRADHVHLLDLRDDTGSLIYPDDPIAQPFSLRQTCQECHDYDLISTGWHFNAVDPEVDPGRRGEPWVLVDHISATQVPLSHRDWAGTADPEEFGLSPFLFMEEFGRHLPGGGVGEMETDEPLETYVRWLVSGRAEVNCLSCHDREAGHDQAEYDRQMLQQNFRWAAAATSGFATVSGSAKNMPDNYDVYSGGGPALNAAAPPSVAYDTSRFNAQGKVLFEVPRRAPAERCYFCHSSSSSEARLDRWQADQDVHMAAGLTCVDCHRNGLDHQIVRGYEWEAVGIGDSSVAALSCSGCHIPDLDSGVPMSGSLGAPEPAHRGIPVVHFDKLACTACHSGPWPTAQAQRVRLSRTHALGTHGVRKGDRVAPYVHGPVYVKDDDGKIAPHRMIWPSFWGLLTESASGEASTIVPATLDEVRSAVLAVLLADEPEGGPNVSRVQAGGWPLFSESQIVQILEDFSGLYPDMGTPVYVGGGLVVRVLDGGLTLDEGHPSAQPYSWALAHDVRPAGQSLGIRGCDDCHALGAAFSFGTVSAPVPFEFAEGTTLRMSSLQDAGTAYPRILALSFLFRPLVKYTILLSCLILVLVLLLYSLRGLESVLRAAARGSDG